MLDASVREVLRKIIDERGQDACSNVNLIRALLGDQCKNANKTERNMLVLAVQANVPSEMATATAMPWSLLRTRMIARLRDELGMEVSNAEWVIDSWSYALRITPDKAHEPEQLQPTPSVPKPSPLPPPIQGETVKIALTLTAVEARQGGKRTVLVAGRQEQITIPPGLTGVQNLTFASQGGPGKNGGANGALLVQLTVLPDLKPMSGKDVVSSLNLSWDEAQAGCKRTISINGKDFKIAVPANIQNNQQLSFAGQGEPGQNGGANGNLIVKVTVTPQLSASALPALDKPPTPVQSAPDPTTEGNLIWRWNAQGDTTPAFTPSQPDNLSPANIASKSLNHTRGILGLLSGARNTRNALLAFLVVGGLAAFGVIFMQKYNVYKASAEAQQVTTLIAQGSSAYTGGDFAGAAKLLEQALTADTVHAERAKIQTELGYTYVQLARGAQDNGRTVEAINDYQKAINYSPDYAIARTELSILLEKQGDHNGAKAQQDAIKGTNSDHSAPPISGGNTHSPKKPNGHSVSGSTNDPNQFLNAIRTATKQLIQDGDTLYRQGKRDQARQKWTDAMIKGVGLPERDEAKKRLHDTEELPDFSN